MSPEQKILSFKLLTERDHYLMKRVSRTGVQGFMLYYGRQQPVKFFTAATVRKFSTVLDTDGKKRMWINLRKVRQLHGKNYIKQTYKKLQIKLEQP